MPKVNSEVVKDEFQNRWNYTGADRVLENTSQSELTDAFEFPQLNQKMTENNENVQFATPPPE